MTIQPLMKKRGHEGVPKNIHNLANNLEFYELICLILGLWLLVDLSPVVIGPKQMG